MKITIVGAGNMGGAIACGLASTSNELVVIDHRGNNVQRLKDICPSMNVQVADYSLIDTSDVVILAIKDWFVEDFLKEHKERFITLSQIIVSVGAINTLHQLKEWTSPLKTIYRAMPNTAVALGQSMTFLARTNHTSEQDQQIVSIFSEVGKVEVVDEKMFSAAMPLASCGIAFAFRYIRASMEGGVELGFRPDQSKEVVLQTLKGAVALLEANGLHPEQEIDKVTTAGGITIKGLNEMEHAGFTSSVIRGLKASCG